MIIAYLSGWEGNIIIIPISIGLVAWYLNKELSKPKDADILNEQFKRFKKK